MAQGGEDVQNQERFRISLFMFGNKSFMAFPEREKKGEEESMIEVRRRGDHPPGGGEDYS